jgi:predicted acyltransferase
MPTVMTHPAAPVTASSRLVSLDAFRGATIAPSVILGMNAIAIYVASEVIELVLQLAGWRQPIYEALFAPLASPQNASSLYATAYTGSMLLLAWAMYRRGWFIRV